ncbi:MAG: fimbrillin family protein, partial [Alistipes sp.]|nr:fimbrillin family protein [Alistipes sp.]
MKRFVSVVAVALAALSCQSEVVNNPNTPLGNDNEVCFAMPVDATRTSIDADGIRTRWAEGDEIAVWAKDANDNYTFSNSTFMLRYFSTEWDKAYFVGNIAQMAEGDYTYYISYPRPTSVEGTLATYTVAAEQSGAYDGKYDIMVAEPTLTGSLTTGKRIEMNSVMRHQMHALKITIPEKASNFDTKVYALDITFPMPVVGDITIDVTDL